MTQSGYRRSSVNYGQTSRLALATFLCSRYMFTHHYLCSLRFMWNAYDSHPLPAREPLDWKEHRISEATLWLQSIACVNGQIASFVHSFIHPFIHLLIRYTIVVPADRLCIYYGDTTIINQQHLPDSLDGNRVGRIKYIIVVHCTELSQADLALHCVYCVSAANEWIINRVARWRHLRLSSVTLTRPRATPDKYTGTNQGYYTSWMCARARIVEREFSSGWW